VLFIQNSTLTMLTKNDASVLTALFGAESSGKNSAQINPSTSLPGVSQSLLLDLQGRESQTLRLINDENPAEDQIQKAVDELTTIVGEHPEYASAWNNRAQAVRMLVGDDLTTPAAAASTLYQDLCTAIELASPSSASASVSALQSKILASAYTHRAHLLLKASRSLKLDQSKALRLQKELARVGEEGLERLAGRDFTAGGKYGNAIARQMAVQLNPYAKLCGEIVREAMVNDFKAAHGIKPTVT